jgi:hypothetical protein
MLQQQLVKESMARAQFFKDHYYYVSGGTSKVPKKSKRKSITFTIVILGKINNTALQSYLIDHYTV